MIKGTITLLSLTFFLISCQSVAKEEAVKTIKSRSASERINSSDTNSNSMLKELDE